MKNYKDVPDHSRLVILKHFFGSQMQQIISRSVHTIPNLALHKENSHPRINGKTGTTSMRFQYSETCFFIKCCYYIFVMESGVVWPYHKYLN